jgi:hypothetical protein
LKKEERREERDVGSSPGPVPRFAMRQARIGIRGLWISLLLLPLLHYSTGWICPVVDLGLVRDQVYRLARLTCPYCRVISSRSYLPSRLSKSTTHPHNQPSNQEAISNSRPRSFQNPLCQSMPALFNMPAACSFRPVGSWLWWTTEWTSAESRAIARLFCAASSYSRDWLCMVQPARRKYRTRPTRSHPVPINGLPAPAPRLHGKISCIGSAGVWACTSRTAEYKYTPNSCRPSRLSYIVVS